MQRPSLTIVLLVAWLAAAWAPHLTRAQEFDEKFEHWPVDLKINGRIIVAGELADVEVLKDVLRPAGRNGNAAPQKRGALLATGDVDDDSISSLRALWKDAEQEPQVVVAASPTELAAQIGGLLEECGAFCWLSSQPLADAMQDEWLKCREALQAHLDEGGTILAVGPSASLLSSCCIATNGVSTPGLNLLPDCVLETDYDDGADRGRLLSVLALRPRSVGVGLERDTVLVLDGRKMRAAGRGKATFLLMANERQPLRVQSIAQPTSPRQPPEEWLIDLTEWRRDAIDRTLEPFPPARPAPPNVENGTLLIVGGGGLPEGLMERMVELAGGPDQAHMVYIPCAEEEQVREKQAIVEAWRRMGVRQATFIHTKDRRQANSDEEFLAPLKTATGIWFGGGRQWNFSDSYYGTEAHRLMKEVLKRGGVIGGSSAGASIQARYLARGTPIGNERIMAPGYERGGLGFLSGVAIDQHFSQRGRQKDMTQLVDRYPQLLGIGLDEGTAIVVQKATAEVVGKGKAHFYDRDLPVYPDRPDYIALPAGSSYDLAARKILHDAAAEPQKDPPQAETPSPP